MAKLEVKTSRKKPSKNLKTLAKRLKAGTTITRTIPAKPGKIAATGGGQ